MNLFLYCYSALDLIVSNSVLQKSEYSSAQNKEVYDQLKRLHIIIIVVNVPFSMGVTFIIVDLEIKEVIIPKYTIVYFGTKFNKYIITHPLL